MVMLCLNAQYSRIQVKARSEKLVMNDSSMFALIVWKMKCALHKLFAWQCLLFMSSSSIMLGCHAYQNMLRRPEQSAKSKPALPTSSALTISWWLKQLFLQTKEQQIPPQIPWKHNLSFKQEYAALKCTPNEQNKRTNKQATKKAQKPFIPVKNSMWAIAIHLATFHFWLWPVFGSTVQCAFKHNITITNWVSM